MIIAIDVYYANNRAKSVGVMFKNWDDSQPQEIITSFTENPMEYEPGSFYKRELPCIQTLLTQVDLDILDAIIVDGHVYLDDNKKPGLGHYVYQYYKERIPVIGVAKNAFYGNKNIVAEVLRGDSAKPLFVTAAGIDTEEAVTRIKSMYGAYRFPHLLKLLDVETKTGWESVTTEQE